MYSIIIPVATFRISDYMNHLEINRGGESRCREGTGPIGEYDGWQV